MLLPVAVVVQVVVPQDVTQVLAFWPVVPQTWPDGQFASLVHWTQLPAGSIDIPAGRRSQILSVVSSAQSVSAKHPTQRLLGRSQMLLPVGFVVHITVPHIIVQVLAVLPVMLHVAPIGQCALSRHCTHW
jgi:hypothetical protein